MATIESIMTGARSYIRDFPKYFTASVERQVAPRVLKLPHANVAPQELYIQAVGPTDSLTGLLQTGGGGIVPSATEFTYTLDVREGLVKVLQAPTDGWGDTKYFNIDGYYFEWIAPADMRFAAEVVLAEHADDDPDFAVHNVADAHEDVICLGTAIEICWSLLFQFSRDIDVSTPEAIGLPLSQRYRQVEDLTARLVDKYRTKAGMLGVGVERIKVSQLRRQSRSINRLVPVYLPREWDDAAFPVRLFPKIDQTSPSTPDEDFTPAKAITGYYEEIKPYTDVSDDE
jgi:hypothetical protein